MHELFSLLIECIFILNYSLQWVTFRFFFRHICGQTNVHNQHKNLNFFFVISFDFLFYFRLLMSFVIILRATNNQKITNTILMFKQWMKLVRCSELLLIFMFITANVHCMCLCFSFGRISQSRFVWCKYKTRLAKIGPKRIILMRKCVWHFMNGVVVLGFWFTWANRLNVCCWC